MKKIENYSYVLLLEISRDNKPIYIENGCEFLNKKFNLSKEECKNVFNYIYDVGFINNPIKSKYAFANDARITYLGRKFIKEYKHKLVGIITVWLPIIISILALVVNIISINK